jgi:hypothetical protein
MAGKARRVSVKVRKSAMNDDAMIVEATAPDGSSVLVSFGSIGGIGLIVHPYRVDAMVKVNPCSYSSLPAVLDGPERKVAT